MKWLFNIFGKTFDCIDDKTNVLQKHEYIKIEKKEENTVVPDTYINTIKKDRKYITKEGLELIKYFEGFCAKPYLDAVGVPTIGYGNTYYEDGTKVALTDKPITEERGSQLFNIIVGRFEKDVIKILPDDHKLNDNQISALISFAYNVGIGNLKDSTLLTLINKKDYNGAAEEFPRWNKAGGKPLKGLIIRRYCERALFLGQDWKKARAEKKKELGI